MDTTNKKAAYNIGGAIVGFLLAGLSIFGLIHSQEDSSQQQKYQSTISYDG